MSDKVISEQFHKIFPTANLEFVEALNKFLPNNNINTFNRITCFLAQTGHESGGFKIFVENLNYSAEGLLKVFPKYFDVSTANKYARNPMLIANRVYANRMGNGPEESGDGWKYRGRGLIQLTGKNNYTKFITDTKKDYVTFNVDYLMTIEGAVESACWFWNKYNCNSIADVQDIKRLTKTINGGYIGLQERIDLYNKIKTIVKFS